MAIQTINIGTVPNDGTGDRLRDAFDKVNSNFAELSGSTGGLSHSTASGTDTYTATITGVTSYADGDAYLIRFTNGNTATCTLNINSLGDITLYRNNDGPIVGGDITSGSEMLCIYDSVLGGFRLIGTSANALYTYVTNAESITITKGQPVYVYGGVGDRVTVKLAYNTSDATSAQTLGLVLSASIGANQKGIIVSQGSLDGLNLFPTSIWSDGDFVYLGATAGTLTKVKPSAPNHLVYLGYVTTANNGSAGRMYVKVQNGYEMDELHNVAISSVANNDTIVWESSTSLWKNKSISTTLGYTPARESIKLTSQTLILGSWSLVGGYYTYSFSNANIDITCEISVTPQNASYQTAYNANILPYIGVASGVATFYSQFPPPADMIVDIVITQTA